MDNRNNMIREIYWQTGSFADGVDVECPNIQITNQVSFINWISRLPSWTFGIHIPRVQIIRERAGGAGPPDTPPRGGGAHDSIDPTTIEDPGPL